MIYKIMRKKEWDETQVSGVFKGSPDDLRDGFIHFSAAHQVRATVEKHFAGEEDLLLIAIDPASLADKLRWEVSRGGDKFPHLYGELPLNLATVLIEIRRDASGEPILPLEIP
ncbi:MAG TPA: DUF952 domain-containing protein [Micropepsaceae bacterium]|nr:DUF952 domain-containing protein [Micropepsaceae bacterium]